MNSGTLKDEFLLLLHRAPLALHDGWPDRLRLRYGGLPSARRREAFLRQRRPLGLGNVSAAGPDSTTGCYATLVNDQLPRSRAHHRSKDDDLGAGNFTAANGTAAPAISTCIAALSCRPNCGHGLRGQRAGHHDLLVRGVANEPGDDLLGALPLYSSSHRFLRQHGAERLRSASSPEHTVLQSPQLHGYVGADGHGEQHHLVHHRSGDQDHAVQRESLV